MHGREWNTPPLQKHTLSLGFLFALYWEAVEQAEPTLGVEEGLPLLAVDRVNGIGQQGLRK